MYPISPRRILALFSVIILALAACGDDTGVGSRSPGDGDGQTFGDGNNPGDNPGDNPADNPGDGGDNPGDGGDNPGDGGDNPGDGGDNPGDGTGGGDNPLASVDSDGDLISDYDEGSCAIDTDADTVPDCRDLDSDADGIPDEVESGDSDLTTAPFDFDEDGVPNFQDFDSDGDGILDALEGLADPDEDGKGNWLDLDSDGDGLGDEMEGTDDFDDDLIPNYLDIDSDNDTIADWVEGFDNSDTDGQPDRTDLDSDNDGLTDRQEAGDGDLETIPVDSDNDGLFDFRDPDSDDDGLYDGVETGCPETSNRLVADSDADGYSDLAEAAVGSDACSAGSDVYDFVEFFFILPYEGPQQQAPLEFSTDVRKVDVHFNMDTTYSMNGEITALRTTIAGTIIPGVEAALSTSEFVADAAFGVSEFQDFPVSTFGTSGTDHPFRLRTRITTNANAAESATQALALGDGYDLPESGWESLYQIATGDGQSGWCSQQSTQWGPCSAANERRIASFNPSAGLIPGVADGTIGGVGFRDGAFPIVVHITDDRSHNSGDYSGWVDQAHSRAQAVNELNGISARVIGVASGGSARADLLQLARDTDAVVPVCAFDGARPAGCSSNQCCTGVNGAGVTADAGAVCPLVFDISSSGTGLSTAAIDAITFLATSGTLEVTTEVVADASEPEVDTSCFIEAVIPNHAVAPDLCAGAPTIANNYGDDAIDDSFENVTPGTQVFFDVFASNPDCAEPTQEPQVFSATILVKGDGVTILDSLEVTIIVPPADLSGPK